MSCWQDRTVSLLGQKAFQRLKDAHVCVVGLGGVGSYVFEALIRTGVGKLTLVDHDVVDITNINRQLVASMDTVGMKKVDIAKQHAKFINPDAVIHAVCEFITEENVDRIISSDVDIIIDAIDSVNSKIELIQFAKQRDITIYSSMGTANKLDPSGFIFDDISKTSVDPLSKVMRRELKNLGISDLKVVYSIEKPKVNEQNPKSLGSVMYVPASAGLLLAGKAVEYILGCERIKND